MSQIQQDKISTESTNRYTFKQKLLGGASVAAFGAASVTFGFPETAVTVISTLGGAALGVFPAMALSASSYEATHGHVSDDEREKYIEAHIDDGLELEILAQQAQLAGDNIGREQGHNAMDRTFAKVMLAFAAAGAAHGVGLARMHVKQHEPTQTTHQHAFGEFKKPNPKTTISYADAAKPVVN